MEDDDGKNTRLPAVSLTWTFILYFGLVVFALYVSANLKTSIWVFNMQNPICIKSGAIEPWGSKREGTVAI